MQAKSALAEWRRCGIRISAAALLTLPLTAPGNDWLYLSPDGGWLQQSVSVDGYPHTLEIPGHAERIWVAPESGDGDLIRERHSEVPVMEPGTEVEIATSVRLPGIGPLVAGERLTVRQILGDRIVVSVDDKAVVLGPDSYSTLAFQVTPIGMDRVRLEADRSAPETRTLAWQSNRLSGEVVYRLEMGDDDTAELRQYLQVHNEGAVSLRAAGLSWFPAGGDSVHPRGAMMTSVAAERAVETAAGPIAALELADSIRLPARAVTWMPVSAQPVTVRYRYDLSWDTRQDVIEGRAADWRLRVEAEQELPRLAGRAEVNWFDRRLASMDSRYRRVEAQATELSLGSNDQVTLTVVPEGEGMATLRVHNHLEQPVAVAVAISHQPDRQAAGFSERRVMTVAPGVTELSARYHDGGLELADR